ncbi:MAG: CocE/NonD family hydrolase [Planctomycetota bacterium]|nr:CocE/NonD family hydrolase [Planctomycetota bacterium]
MRIRFLHLALAIALAATLGSDSAHADKRADQVRSRYTKFEYRIPMRDGVRLFTAVYVPNHPTKTYPILMTRTPYSCRPYGVDQYRGSLGPGKVYEDEGYIFVFQDVRGRYMSEGTHVNMRPHIAEKQGTQIDESTDTYDTIEWLLENVPNHNGRVGMWGVSYPGFYCSAGMIDSHPALKAVSPQAPIADWFWDDMHHHGAFVLPLSYIFFSSFGKERKGPTPHRAKGIDLGTPDGYEYFMRMGPLSNANNKGRLGGKIAFWNEMSEHPNYDAFWQSRNILPHLKNIKAAVLVVGGWYDTEDLYGPLKTYASVEAKNPDIDNHLVMGPWSHGAWRGAGDKLGDAEFGFRTGDWFRKNIELPFFNHYLKGKAKHTIPEALMFETGANRWRRFDQWPPAQAKAQKLYLAGGGRVTIDEPANENDAADAYISDPDKPVPYTNDITRGWSTGYMAEDQRFAARRPDVLVYQTDVLEDDLTLAGPIQATLYVSTTGTASDFVVKVIDVFPDKVPKKGGQPDRGGQQTLVRADVIRGRFRESYETPKPFVPGEVAKVSFELSDVLHTFKRGHRLMIQVQSTWFPFIDRNPQKYVPNIFKARAEDFIKVTNRVHRSRAHPSNIEVRVLR